MFVRIHKASEYVHGNSDSCAGLVQYLEKENKLDGVELEDREMFFSHDIERFSGFNVTNSIDNNVAKLSKNEARYYMVSVNPSQDELQHISKQVSGRNVSSIEELTKSEKLAYENALKDYSRGVMDEYARNFNKGLEGKDLLYYGKLEHERTYSRFDQKYKDGLVKLGEKKPGFQSHLHVIVSRKDKTNTKRLSPFSNHKNSKNKLNNKEVQIGFNRKEFAQKCESKFDTMYNYNRLLKNSFQYRYSMKNVLGNIARSYARQGIPVLGSTEKVFRITDNISNDPLKSLNTVLSQNKQFVQAVKMAQMAVRPEKIVLEIAKKLPRIIEGSTSLKL